MQIPNLADAEDATQAQVDSRDFSDILAPAFSYTGVLSGCAVTAQGTPNMTVAISAGVVVVNGVVVTVAAGNVTISANASGNARFDLICVDAAGVKSAVAGTTSISPVFPNPAGKVVLAAVRVPAGAASISNAKIVDKRIFNTLSSLAFGTTGDVNLYRSSANVLKTDGNFFAGAALVSGLGGAGQVQITSGSEAKILFGISADTNLYRSGANDLRTDGILRAMGNDVAMVTIGGGVGTAPIIYFGNALDTNLYRQAAGALATDGTFNVGGNIGAAGVISAGGRGFFNDGIWLDGGTSRFIGTQGAGIGIYVGAWRYQFGGDDIFSITGATGKIVIGGDTSLYRAAANVLVTPGAFEADNGIWAARPIATASALAAFITGDSADRFEVWADGSVHWGSGAAALDANLYRRQAGQIKTDGAFFARDAIVVDHGGTGERLWFGSALDASLYRSAASVLTLAGGAVIQPISSAVALTVRGLAGATTINLAEFYDNTGVLRAVVNPSGSILAQFGFGNLAADTSFSFSAGSMLVINPAATVSGLRLNTAGAGLDLKAPNASRAVLSFTNAGLWQFGATGALNPGITFGSAADTSLYRSGASTLKTDGALWIRQQAGVAGAISLLVDSTSYADHVAFIRCLNPSGVQKFNVNRDGAVLAGESFSIGTKGVKMESPNDDGTLRFTTPEVSIFTSKSAQMRWDGEWLQVGTMGLPGAGSRGLALANAATPPTLPTGGGLMYAEAGALKWRGSAGTVTVIAPA